MRVGDQNPAISKKFRAVEQLCMHDLFNLNILALRF